MSLMDDEDAFLYGDDGDEEEEQKITPAAIPGDFPFISLSSKPQIKQQTSIVI